MIRIQDKLISLLSIIFLIVIAIIIFFGTIENGIFLTILSFASIILFVKKVPIKKFYIFLILFSLITKVFFVIVVKTPVMADFYIMLEASQKILVNDFSFVDSVYFNTWGYQLVNVFYQSLALRIVNNVIILKVLNCIYSTSITLLIYLIVKRITNEDTARVTSLLYSISLYPIYLNTVLGNQQLSLLVILSAIYIFLYKKSTYLNLIIVALLIGLGNLIRPEGIVYIISIIGYLILTNEKLFSTIKKIVVVSLIFLVVSRLPSYILIKTGFNEIGLKNNEPGWKFLTGFNYNTKGKYDTADEIYFRNYNQQMKEIKNRMTNFSKMPNLFYQKIKIQWLYSDLDSSFNVQSTTQFSGSIMTIVVNYIKVINVTIIAFSLYSFKKIKGKDKTIYFFQINLLLYFLAYLLIEVHLRYYYNPQIAVIILSSLGISKLLELKYIHKNKIKKVRTN